MGIHRLDQYLEDAVDSILNQTLNNFEFIIVANGTNAHEIKEYIEKKYSYDDRIIVLESRIGQLAHALNIAAEQAKYDYIARMDSDDVAHPERLEKQILYLTSHNLDLVGTSVRLINERSEVIGERKTKTIQSINDNLLFRNCFIHPSIMLRKEVFYKARGYNAGFNSEDYDLWLRLRRMGVKWDNMEENLLDYRIHSAASQGRLLGYAEIAGYMVREFLLHKTIKGLFALVINFFKALVKPDRSKDIY